MRFARSNNAAKRQPERATPWHRMLKDTKDDDDEDSNEAAASSTPSDLAPKRKSVEPDEEEVKAASNAKVSKVEGATDVTTKAAPNAAKKDVEDVSDDDGDDDGSEDGEDDDAEGAEDDDVEGAGDSEDDDEEEEDDEEDEEDEKPAKKSSPKAAKGNSKGTDKPISTGMVCFKCRQEGHYMKECPNMKAGEDANICYKCGSTEHFAYKCKIKSKESMPYAKCFVCNKMGHIARACPQNKNGVYPNGGKCDLCDSNKHFKSECPTIKNKYNKQKVVVAMRGNSNISADLDYNDVEFKNNSHQDSLSSKKTRKTVKF